MHFFCIFLQKYLHIWNIFCTFASDLGIVPAITIKYKESMENECIWKCQKGKVIVKVVKVISDWRFHCATYRVYVGRKWWNHIAYINLEAAIKICVEVALLEEYDVVITKRL